MDRYDLSQTVREPPQALQVALCGQLRSVDAEEPPQHRQGSAVERVGGEQVRNLRPQSTVDLRESLPRWAPGMVPRDRQRGHILPVVVPPDLWKPHELQPGHRLGRALIA